MKCRNCGTELNDEVKFCSNCGSKIENEKINGIGDSVDENIESDKQLETKLQEDTVDEEKSNKENQELSVTMLDKFKAHPIRFIMCIPFYILEIKLIIAFVIHADITDSESWITLISYSLAYMLFIWLIYGPINKSRLYREKELDNLEKRITKQIKDTNK